MSDKTILAALQIGSHPDGKAATLDHVLSFEGAIADSGARLVVMPEALLGGYPKGERFGTHLGYRLPEGREAFARYHANAIDLDGPEIAALAGLAERTGAMLVLGVIGYHVHCRKFLRHGKAEALVAAALGELEPDAGTAPNGWNFERIFAKATDLIGGDKPARSTPQNGTRDVLQPAQRRDRP